MGWLCISPMFWKNGKVDKKAEADHILNDSISRVLKSCVVGNIHYAAVEDIVSGQVFCSVSIIRVGKEQYWLDFKHMTEFDGPIYHDCPKSILKMLSPTDDKIALKWRADCEEKHDHNLAKVPVGSVIEWVSTSGKKYQCLKCAPQYQFKTPWFMDLTKDHVAYFPKKYIPHTWKVVSPYAE